jgi:hypothetical protein
MRWLLTLFLFLSLAAVLLFGWIRVRNQRETKLIQQRYEEMRQAVAADDAPAMRELIAPGYRDRKNIRYDFLGGRGPVDEDWHVWIFGNHADVSPNQIYHFKILPGGNSIAMIKVDRQWYFTGAFGID